MRIVEVMYDINDESLKRWKQALAKDGIEYETDAEYCEAIRNFTGFVDTLIEIDKKLKEDEIAGRIKDDGDYLYDNDGNKIIL